MLLDDPLSALDATVAQEVYKNAIAGVLADKCATQSVFLRISDSLLQTLTASQRCNPEAKRMDSWLRAWAWRDVRLTGNPRAASCSLLLRRAASLLIGPERGFYYRIQSDKQL